MTGVFLPDSRWIDLSPNIYPFWSEHVRKSLSLSRRHPLGSFHEQAKLSSTDLPPVVLAVIRSITSSCRVMSCPKRELGSRDRIGETMHYFLEKVAASENTFKTSRLSKQQAMLMDDHQNRGAIESGSACRAMPQNLLGRISEFFCARRAHIRSGCRWDECLSPNTAQASLSAALFRLTEANAVDISLVRVFPLQFQGFQHHHQSNGRHVRLGETENGSWSVHVYFYTICKYSVVRKRHRFKF